MIGNSDVRVKRNDTDREMIEIYSTDKPVRLIAVVFDDMFHSLFGFYPNQIFEDEDEAEIEIRASVA